MKSEEVIKDFVRWITGQVNPADLSALMSKHGYTDDSQDSIIDALETRKNFAKELGVMIKAAVENNKREKRRSIGGVTIENDDLTIEDWKEIFSKQLSNKATGGLNDKAGNENKNSNWWTTWGSQLFGGLINTAGGVAESIWGKDDSEDNNQQNQSSSGQMTFIYIIIAVVVIAVVGVLWMSLKKK